MCINKWILNNILLSKQAMILAMGEIKIMFTEVEGKPWYMTLMTIHSYSVHKYVWHHRYDNDNETNEHNYRQKHRWHFIMD